MNVLAGKILSVHHKDEISLVKVELKRGEIFNVLMLDFPSLQAKLNSNIELLFKEDELILSPQEVLLGVENQLSLEIQSFKKGEILTQFFFKENLSALLSNEASKLLNLNTAQKIFGYIKPSDIMLKV
ncbi:hypothetical protein [Campylobacter sp. MIT 97-5078]|uniref:hypothetical protein n=1 Tax=Campylobacter sp. MIT 97-5078 TaxID=1548153 RepID=UPI0005138170|nr:hypothetical protein [Campylobacter sp. MIT 97-5078]KGI56666.1 hypothetical protein LR59_06270 [Campylobacter sp. MIT 97-5078]TQR27122.1 molybdenum-pterin-binding protein [Campylobacter sp. MIT 97-5078]